MPADQVQEEKRRIRQHLSRFRRRLLGLRERIRFSQEALHLGLAGVVGLAGGAINVGFISLVELLQSWAAPLWQEGNRLWGVTLIGWGGLVAGLVLRYGLGRERGKSHGFLEAVVLGDGRLPFRSALVKGASSLCSIATGAPVGREGSITRLAATFASRWGRIFGCPPYRLRLLVACGAASGMAAAYNAPIAGAVFAAQIVLGNFAMNLFAPLVFASVIATMVSRSVFGIAPLYTVPDLEFTASQFLLFLIPGVLCGMVAALFQKSLRTSERLHDFLDLPLPLRLALGGLVAGFLALLVPGVIGNGYQETDQALQGQTGAAVLMGQTVARFLATVCVVGAGTLGGIFTPSLFLGAGVGGLYYYAFTCIFGESSLPIGAFVLVGMGGLLAGVTHAPLLAMIMILELTLNYSLVPPLMAACVLSTLVARSFHRDNIYSEGLELKGLESSWETERMGVASRRRIGDLMLAPIPPLHESDTFACIADRFLRSTHHFLPVVDGAGRLVGVVALQDLKAYLTMGDHLVSVIAMDVMRPPPRALTPNQRLEEALSALLASEARNIHVVNNHRERRLIGTVVRSEVLGLLAEAISARQESPR